MKMAEQRISDFLERLASDAPAPGGGSAAALNGALGAALVHMVAALTAEKARYAQFEALAQELLRESQKLMDEFLVLIDRDIAAFSVVAGVYAMPKGTEDEKAVRRAAMQEALRGGAAPPLALMRCALDALKLTKRAVGHSNPNVASDLGVAALNLKAAAQSGWLNVVVNINSIKDEEFVQDARREGEALLEACATLADEIFQEVLAAL